jgi:myo-inositol 2-dehydrogenase/D-chiro-inositol 1-dehydrogenase
VGEAASIALNPVAYTRLDAALTTGTAYDADWRSRYREAYVRQNRAFLRFVQTGEFPTLASSAWDGYASAIVAEAGVRALASGQKTPVTMIAQPELYA